MAKMAVLEIAGSTVEYSDGSQLEDRQRETRSAGAFSGATTAQTTLHELALIVDVVVVAIPRIMFDEQNTPSGRVHEELEKDTLLTTLLRRAVTFVAISVGTSKT